MVKDASKMRELVRADHAYKLFKNVRGSPAYYQTLFYEVLAMMRQLGLPTWFFTVSAADMQWPDLLQTISRQYGTILSDDDVKNLSYQERTRLLRSNPVTAARHFQYRLELLFKDVLKSKANPLGEIIDYVIRIEFQARGSPHAHTVLWVKNAPRIDIDTDEQVRIHGYLPLFPAIVLITTNAVLSCLACDCRIYEHCRDRVVCRID